MFSPCATRYVEVKERGREGRGGEGRREERRGGGREGGGREGGRKRGKGGRGRRVGRSMDKGDEKISLVMCECRNERVVGCNGDCVLTHLCLCGRLHMYMYVGLV